VVTNCCQTQHFSPFKKVVRGLVSGYSAFLIFVVSFISDSPEIEVERSWVHSGEGFEAQLVCIVHAEPAPSVSFFIYFQKEEFFYSLTLIIGFRIMSSKGVYRNNSKKDIDVLDSSSYQLLMYFEVQNVLNKR